MRIERRDRKARVRPHAEARVIRTDALERVPDGVTVPDLIARIEWEADKEAIGLLRRTSA